MTRAAPVMLAVVLTLAGVAACSGDGPGAGGLTEYDSVREIVDVLSGAGVECELEGVRDAEELARRRERAEARAPTPDPYVQYIEAPDLPVRESGTCVFPGSPEVAGKEAASVIAVYEDRSHLRSAEDVRFEGIAYVYGANWSVALAAVDLAPETAEALGGRLNPALEVPPEEAREIVERAATSCFLNASLGHGLDELATRAGVDPDDLGAVAEVLVAMSVVEPETRSHAEARCLRGLRVARAVREDARMLGTPRFRSFWMGLCDTAPTDYPLLRRLGFAGGYSYEEVGRKLTRFSLAATSVPAGDVRDLARACGKRYHEASGLSQEGEIDIPEAPGT